MRNNEDRFNPAAQSAAPGGLHYVVPTELVELPSKGRFYPEGHPLHNKDFVEIKHMTAKEEDILTSTTLIEKGVVLQYLVASLLMDKQINPQSLLPGDQNAILLNARVNAYGNDYSFESKCDSCEKLVQTEVDLNEISTKETEGDYYINQDGCVSLKLEKSNFSIELKQLTLSEIEAAQKNNNAYSTVGSTTRLLLSIIKTINGETNDGGLKFINVIENLPSKDVRQLKEAYNKTKPDIDFSLVIECKTCGHTKEGTMPITAKFFWPDA